MLGNYIWAGLVKDEAKTNQTKFNSVSAAESYASFEDVMNGKYLRRWESDGYNYFCNVVKTGNERYGDYTFVITVQTGQHKKFGRQSECSKELLTDTIAFDWVVWAQAADILKKYKDVIG